jgi:hypothetical protein
VTRNDDSKAVVRNITRSTTWTFLEQI